MWGRSFDLDGGLGDLLVSSCSEVHDSVSSIEGGPNLLIGLDKSFELDIEVSILATEDVAVGLDSVDLSLEVAVSLHEVVIRESEVILLLSGNHELIVGVPQLVLPLKCLGSKISVSGVLSLSLSLEVGLLGELTIKVSLKGLGLNHKSGVVVLGSGKLGLSVLESLVSSSELEVLGIGELGELVGLLLSLVEIVVDGLDLGIIILALSLLESNGVSQTVDLVLILGLLLAELGKLILEVVSVLSKSVGLIRLHGDLSLEGDALLLSSADLVSNRADLGLILIVGSILLVEEESQVLDLLSEGVDGDDVLIMPVVVVIILHEFLILNVSILLLDGVELVPQSEIVLVSLLDLKDLSLQLGDQQVLLVTSEMNGVVVLR